MTRTPSVRLLLLLLVAVPTLSTGIIVASDARSNWSYREDAQVAASDATTLQTLALARAELNSARVPAEAVSFAASIGVNENLLSSLLGIDFKTALAASEQAMTSDPTFSSTPMLREDLAVCRSIIPEISAGTIGYPRVKADFARFASDVDDAWYAVFAKLQVDAETWRPPGSFEVQLAALRQTYAAFLAGGDEIEGSIYVLEGQGGTPAKQEIVQSSAVFSVAVAQFSENLGPKASAAWDALRTDPANRSFEQTIAQAVSVALTGSPPPFEKDVAQAGVAMRKGLHYLGDLDSLVRSASADLHDLAMTQASGASSHFVRELVLLTLFCVGGLGAVILGARILSRPIKRLAEAAQQVHDGDFDLKPIPNRGPKELSVTTAAFNDMAMTLKAVEAKTIGLASEDLSNPELRAPLPGRTGQALQLAVDKLVARIHEREDQRRQLHEAATHDRLTGLLNRPAVIDFLSNDVTRRREAGETVAVLFVDIDELKPINDLYGHEVGDAAIRATGRAIARALGACDVVGRLGGDEFLAVLCSEHSRDGSDVTERIRREVSGETISVRDMTVPLNCSVGVALARCDADTDPMELMNRADQAMYEAKRTARAERDRLAAETSKESATLS